MESVSSRGKITLCGKSIGERAAPGAPIHKNYGIPPMIQAKFQGFFRAQNPTKGVGICRRIPRGALSFFGPLTCANKATNLS